jgi:hypothetical protein
VHPFLRGYIFHFNAQRGVRSGQSWSDMVKGRSGVLRHTSRNTSYPALVTICSTGNLIVNNRAHCDQHTSPTRLLSLFIWPYHNPSILACLFNLTPHPRYCNRKVNNDDRASSYQTGSLARSVHFTQIITYITN